MYYACSIRDSATTTHVNMLLNDDHVSDAFASAVKIFQLLMT